MQLKDNIYCHSTDGVYLTCKISRVFYANDPDQNTRIKLFNYCIFISPL